MTTSQLTIQFAPFCVQSTKFHDKPDCSRGRGTADEIGIAANAEYDFFSWCGIPINNIYGEVHTDYPRFINCLLEICCESSRQARIRSDHAVLTGFMYINPISIILDAIILDYDQVLFGNNWASLEGTDDGSCVFGISKDEYHYCHLSTQSRRI